MTWASCCRCGTGAGRRAVTRGSGPRRPRHSSTELVALGSLYLDEPQTPIGLAALVDMPGADAGLPGHLAEAPVEGIRRVHGAVLHERRPGWFPASDRHGLSNGVRAVADGCPPRRDPGARRMVNG